MAIITKPLTNTEVKQAKPKVKEYNLNDGDGLMLRVTPNSTKTWLFNYYHPITGKRKNLTLGKYPALSLADARKERMQARELLAKNIDPKEHRDDEKRQQFIASTNTLKNVAESWFQIKKGKIAETTSRSLWRNFENHVFPTLGHRPIDKLLAPEVISAISPLAANGSLETTSKIIGHLNEVMTYAVNTGLLQHNSLAGIRAAFETPKVTNQPSLKPEEISELMKAINYSTMKLVTRCLMEWQFHTMVRPGEAAGSRWDEIKLDKKVWIIPAERMKMKKEHTVPLTDQALSILEMVRPVSGHREHIFPSDRNPNKPSNSEVVNNALKRIGFKGRLVAHGMRSLASTTLNEVGKNSDLIESALAHIDANQVRGAYNRAEYLERRRELMNWWSEHIMKAAALN